MNLEESTAEQLLIAAAQAQNEQAELIIAAGVRRFPDDSRIIIAHAMLANQRRDWNEGVKRWDVVLTQFPEMPDGPIGMSEALLALRRYQDVKAILDPARRFFSGYRQVHLMAGWAATEGKDIGDAEEIWRYVRTHFPEESGGYLGWARILKDNGRLDEAEAVLRQGAETLPGDFDIAVDLAWISRDRRDWAEAISRWRDAVARFSDRLEAHIGLGDMLATAWAIGDRKSEYIDQVRETFAAAVRRFANSFRLAAAHAEALTKLHDWSGAAAVWRGLLAALPDDPAAHAGHGRALRESGAFDEAIAALDEALRRFPGAMIVRLEMALSLAAKRDWPNALAQWEILKREHPAEPSIRENLRETLWQARQDQGVAAMAGQAFVIPAVLLEEETAASAHFQAVAALLMKFESLGSNCEFGLVQRRYGAEPLGLLRWAAIDPDKLIAALESRLAGVGDPEHTAFQVHNDEYFTEDRRYYMLSHTFTSTAAEPIERFTPLQCRRLQFLRRKLLADLAGAAKIYVFKANDGISDAQISALHAAMCGYSPANNLLCVRLAGADFSAGTLERRNKNLFIGYLDRFSNVDPAVETWISLCRLVTEAMA